METIERQKCPPSRHSRKSLRLTFLVSNGKVRLISQERMAMITPPQVGELPEIGKHGGFWIELRDANSRVLAHRLVDPNQLNSVEVHSPEGKIERRFGEVKDGIFEVLLPDDDDATSVFLMGEPLVPTKAKAKRTEISGEIARFEISARQQGDEQ